MAILNIYDDFVKVINAATLDPNISDSDIILFTSKSGVASLSVTKLFETIGLYVVTPKLLDLTPSVKVIKVKVVSESDIYYQPEDKETPVKLVGVELAKLFKRVIYYYIGALFPNQEVDIKIKYKPTDENLVGDSNNYNHLLNAMGIGNAVPFTNTVDLNNLDSMFMDTLKNMETYDPDVSKLKGNVLIDKATDTLLPIFTLAKYGINVDLESLYQSLSDGISRKIQVSVPETSAFGWSGQNLAGEKCIGFVKDMINEFTLKYSGCIPEIDININIMKGLNWDDEKYNSASLYYDSMNSSLRKFYKGTED